MQSSFCQDLVKSPEVKMSRKSVSAHLIFLKDLLVSHKRIPTGMAVPQHVLTSSTDKSRY